jgi:hypothetical protein
MWEHHAERLEGQSGHKVTFQSHGRYLTRRESLALLAESEEYRSYFIDVLLDLPYRTFRWETPPLTTEALSRTFEFAVIDSPDLELPPDLQTFSNQFRSMGPDSVGEFPNLSGDAQLIVPGPVSETSNYSHLGAFLRSAPPAQRHGLWKLTAEVVQNRIGSDPLWLNTAGAGVSWLHIRLDRRPKYYVYSPYRHADA